MLPERGDLTSAIALSAAREVLIGNGFRVAGEVGITTLQTDRSLLAEDDYSVIALVAYETWSELQEDWANAQAELVSLLARRLARSAPKAWDGYLVLLCTSPATDAAAASQIERDTTRVRKIVAAGDTLRTTADIARILDPFMPLERPGVGPEPLNILESLPSLLKDDVPIAATQAVVTAFKTMEPPLERLHALGDRV